MDTAHASRTNSAGSLRKLSDKANRQVSPASSARAPSAWATLIRSKTCSSLFPAGCCGPSRSQWINLSMWFRPFTPLHPTARAARPFTSRSSWSMPPIFMIAASPSSPRQPKARAALSRTDATGSCCKSLTNLGTARGESAAAAPKLAKASAAASLPRASGSRRHPAIAVTKAVLVAGSEREGPNSPNSPKPRRRADSASSPEDSGRSSSTGAPCSSSHAATKAAGACKKLPEIVHAATACASTDDIHAPEELPRFFFGIARIPAAACESLHIS
mmetsp:Transcript_58957/g.138173  ORF Transcript_58957/g.138173 Transcript_58957/m.138173 type:complete len:274 (+) Transcript_58957:188-1009(+)